MNRVYYSYLRRFTAEINACSKKMRKFTNDEWNYQ